MQGKISRNPDKVQSSLSQIKPSSDFYVVFNIIFQVITLCFNKIFNFIKQFFMFLHYKSGISRL